MALKGRNKGRKSTKSPTATGRSTKSVRVPRDPARPTQMQQRPNSFHVSPGGRVFGTRLLVGAKGRTRKTK